MATLTISPTRLAALKAKYEARTLSEKEYVEYRQAKDGIDAAYARRQFGTSYQSLKISANARGLVAV